MRPMIRLCTALALACAATVLTPATAFSSSAVPAVGLPVTGLALPKAPVPKVALPPAPKVALPPAPKVALPPAPKVALPPAPKVALPPAPKVALPPAPKVSVPALPALRPPAPAPKPPAPVLPVPKPVLNRPAPAPAHEPAPAGPAVEPGQVNTRAAAAGRTTEVASSGSTADRAASDREPQNSAAQLSSDPVGEYLLGLVHDELCVALAAIISPLPARVDGLPSSVIRQLPPSITNVVPQRVLSRASVRCSAAAADGGDDGLTRVLGFLAHSGWSVGALLPLGLTLLGAGMALSRTARVRAITGPCRQRVRRIHLWGSPASSNTAPWAAYPIRS